MSIVWTAPPSVIGGIYHLIEERVLVCGAVAESVSLVFN
jgi:hypothetical protein